MTPEVTWLQLGLLALLLGSSAWGVWKAMLNDRAPTWVRVLAISLVALCYAAIFAVGIGVAPTRLLTIAAALWIAFALGGHRLLPRGKALTDRQRLYVDFHRVAQALENRKPSRFTVLQTRSRAAALNQYRDQETVEFLDLVQAEVNDWAAGRVSPPEAGTARRKQILERGDALFLGKERLRVRERHPDVPP